MKRLLTLILAILIGNSIGAQDFYMGGTVVKKLQAYYVNYQSPACCYQENNLQIKAGKRIRLHSLEIRNFLSQQSSWSQDYYTVLCEIEGDTGLYCIKLSDIKDKVDFDVYDKDTYWNSNFILRFMTGVPDRKAAELRLEAESDAHEYVMGLERAGKLVNDPYLESYIYSLLVRIRPGHIFARSRNDISVFLVNDATANAFMFPNGMLVLTTGLLSAIHSEAELVAILAHEISHYLLNHSIRNIIASENRISRAEFWTVVATGLTAVAEAAVATQTNYIPGAATLAVGAISSVVSSSVVEYLGIKYNHDQEYEADDLAKGILPLLGYDPDALATAFSSIADSEEYDLDSYYFSTYDHPSLKNRIARAGTPKDMVEPRFEKIASFAVTNTALIKYAGKNFTAADELCSRNITNGVATDDDYMIKASCIFNMEDTEDSNAEVANLVSKAKKINPDNIICYQYEILLALRAERFSEAIVLLEQYLEILYSLSEKCFVDSLYSVYAEQKDWAKRMSVKLKGMCND